MSGRKPHPDELQLWQTVVRSVEKTTHRKEVEDPPAAEKTKTENSKKPRRQPGTLHAVTPPKTETLKRQNHLSMDQRTFGRMIRGKLTPDARIDLHGMTRDQAHEALVRFVVSRYQRGARLVLVITGKGRVREDDGPIPARHGVLRHHVPHWLTMPPLGPIVLQVKEAHFSHGGSGALYVYLRKSR